MPGRMSLVEITDGRRRTADGAWSLDSRRWVEDSSDPNRGESFVHQFGVDVGHLGMTDLVEQDHPQS